MQALRISGRRFTTILPAFLMMLVLVPVVLLLIPDEVISDYLAGSSKLVGVLFASFFGSVTLMPGFIAFPLAGMLLTRGVAYMVLSAFTTTLMMVGVLTYPIEKQYFGATVTIIRNALSLLIALGVAMVTGFFFGEIFK
ncbi:hypothetical protein ACFLX9_04415 [Chloroflexota bacterium]